MIWKTNSFHFIQLPLDVYSLWHAVLHISVFPPHSLSLCTLQFVLFLFLTHCHMQSPGNILASCLFKSDNIQGEKRQENRMEKEPERYQRCVGDEKLNFCRDCLGERAPRNPPCLWRHLSLSIIWLLSQQINQITPASLCAGAASTSAVALALKCMRAPAILSLLFI